MPISCLYINVIEFLSSLDIRPSNKKIDLSVFLKVYFCIYVIQLERCQLQQKNISCKIKGQTGQLEIFKNFC